MEARKDSGEKKKEGRGQLETGEEEKGKHGGGRMKRMKERGMGG